MNLSTNRLLPKMLSQLPKNHNVKQHIVLPLFLGSQQSSHHSSKKNLIGNVRCNVRSLLCKNRLILFVRSILLQHSCLLPLLLFLLQQEQIVFQQQGLLVFLFEPFLVQQVVQLGRELLERLLEVQQLLVQSLMLESLIVVLSRSG